MARDAARVLLVKCGMGSSEPDIDHASAATARRGGVLSSLAAASVEASAETCGFFFGQPYAELIRANRWARVPEWTGMWWRQA
jgi:hypothetical protein